MADPTPAETILADNKARIAKLTARELQVVVLGSKGYTQREVADLLQVSMWTVMDHRRRAHKKLDVCTAVEAAVIAAKAGLV